ncbi:MAG: pantoate--beta-alanine ligase [Acidobacteriota bacterium]
MKLYKQIPQLRKKLKEVRKKGQTIGFVPTMGFLHQGHLSLVRESVKETDFTVVSVFVNPTQFGPEEDFLKYPRDLDRDVKLLETEGVKAVFSPSADEMYPEGYSTYVEVHGLQDKLCGRSRTGHFRGVCTVVLKMFNIIRPDIAFFGQKDAQQAVIIRRMVRDLNLDVKIEILPIIRDKDGLALSSRNAYLSSKERPAALVLSRSLRLAEKKFAEGERDVRKLKKAMEEIIIREPSVRIDYLEIVDPDTLESVTVIKGYALVTVAVFIGRVRLIDNTILIDKGEGLNEKIHA